MDPRSGGGDGGGGAASTSSSRIGEILQFPHASLGSLNFLGKPGRDAPRLVSSGSATPREIPRRNLGLRFSSHTRVPPSSFSPSLPYHLEFTRVRASTGARGRQGDAHVAHTRCAPEVVSLVHERFPRRIRSGYLLLLPPPGNSVGVLSLCFSR